ncbi:hypothetical protein DBB42_10725 [Pseudomonas plecoglossicida]|uniref:Uncharacterized protein n=1 Tax=Pseudomonas plecoglossicida TaxID=70775 RepID=A0A2R7ULR6_PSEDL|nr:hypothetical protein DBB42_10725 [Pseudomonas plecoglossicida]
MPRHGRRKWWVGRCGSGVRHLSPDLASSRVNPLPQGPHCSQGLCRTCGSGFTREEAGPAEALLFRLPGRAVPADQVGQLCAPSFRP